MYLIGAILVTALVVTCRKSDDPASHSLLRSIPPDESSITFSNDLTYTEQINPYTFRNFYNGGGVGLGDFNNDGLLDIFFSGNMVSNRLYNGGCDARAGRN